MYIRWMRMEGSGILISQDTATYIIAGVNKMIYGLVEEPDPSLAV